MPHLTNEQIRNFELRQALRVINGNIVGKTEDLSDIGFDVIIVWGASNGVGYGAPIDPIENSSHPQVFQYATTGARANTIYTAVDPLAHREIRANNHGNVFTFAKRLANITPGNRTILILPCALGGTGWADNRWNPGNDLFADTVARANTIMGQSITNRPIAFLHAAHGNDAIALSDTNFTNAMLATVNGFRTQITRAANIPTISIGATDAALPLDGGARGAKELLFANSFPTLISNYIYVSGAGLAAEGDSVHYNGVSQVALGNRVYNAYANWLKQVDERLNPLY